MNACLLVVTLLLAPVAQSSYADPLAEARRLYNMGLYDDAERIARGALEQPASANAARVVLGRIRLERYRRSGAAEDLNDARAALREVDPRQLESRERLELTLGFAETLFLEDRFAAAAELFEPILESSALLGAPAHERVLDWWASALDRHAHTRPMADRAGVYTRITQRMNSELARDPGLSVANYWVVAAARGSGDLDAAWTRAMAAWVRASLARDRGLILRADLDRLMVQGIIPERATRISRRDTTAIVNGLTGEWEAFKAGWAR